MGARYSRHAGYTIARRQQNQRPTMRTVQRRVKFGPTTAKVMGLVVVAILATVMLTQSSTDATNVYKQNNLRKQMSRVDQDIERLRLEAKRAQSIQSIEQTAVKDQMQPTGRIDFVQKEEGDVAGVSTEKQP